MRVSPRWVDLGVRSQPGSTVYLPGCAARRAWSSLPGGATSLDLAAARGVWAAAQSLAALQAQLPLRGRRLAAGKCAAGVGAERAGISTTHHRVVVAVVVGRHRQRAGGVGGAKQREFSILRSDGRHTLAGAAGVPAAGRGGRRTRLGCWACRWRQR
ncbi:MAG: hypothetical protein IPI03_23720 [Rubrivivax sp.]|nr:hypothetical protein [Rubrivivax sp.]